MRDYFGEFRSDPRPLIGAALGLGSGLGNIPFITGIFAPHLMAQFGWSRSAFALVASAGVLVLLALPVWGRLFGRCRPPAIGAFEAAMRRRADAASVALNLSPVIGAKN
jgi:hypothetical protein